MSELDDFEAKVRENIKLLSSDDVTIRRKAAEWLGEAGDPSAITRLRQIYKEDSEKRVREAAEYSLGMFRALEQAWATDKKEKALDLLEDIALRGKMGRRSAIRASSLARLNLGLIVALILLLVFNFVLWPRLKPILNNTQTSSSTTVETIAEAKDRSTLLSEVSSLYTFVNTDALTLQREYQTVLGGGTVNCGAFFNNPAPYDASSARTNPDIVQIVNDLNAALSDLTTAREGHINACPPNNTPLTAAEVGAPMGKLIQALQALPAIENAIASARGDTAEPTAMPQGEATEETAASTPLAVANPRAHLAALYAIIDSMQGANGANLLLNQRWADVRTSNSNAGCGLPIPAIPPNYDLPEIDAQASADLNLAVGLINSGLALVQQGWTQYKNACSSNTLAAALNDGEKSAQNATIAFQNAEKALNAVRGS